MKKIAVGILGATGLVGQQYIHLLKEHPWFEITFLASSEQSAGKKYADAIADRTHYPIQDALKVKVVESLSDIELAKKSCQFVFSALPNEGAKAYEEQYAKAGIPVISNAGYHRLSPDVPVLIPEVNPEHLEIIPIQQQNRGWSQGFIVVKPNCSLQSYMIPLAPLHKRFKIKKILLTTMQAVSGAGYPGVASMDMIDNVIPYIAGEEEKSELEPQKLWGKVEGNQIVSTQELAISAHCNRVPVLDGHMACVSVLFEQKPSLQEILNEWEQFSGLPQELNLPSAPKKPIVYLGEKNRPQPRLDRLNGHGMAVTVGRLRECPVLDYRFVALSHNTIRGAAGGGILNAELLSQQGYLK